MKSQLLRYHLKLLGPRISPFAFALLFSLTSTGIALLPPLFTRVLFDYAYPLRNLALLNYSIIAIIGVYFISLSIDVISDYLFTYVDQEATLDLGHEIYSRAQSLPLSFHQQKTTGDMVIRLTDDVDRGVTFILDLVPSLLISFGQFIAVLVIAFLMSPKLTLLALASIPLYIVETKFYAKRQEKIEEEAINTEGSIVDRVQERVRSIRTIKAYMAEGEEAKSFIGLLKNRYRVMIKQKMVDAISIFTNSLTIQMWSIFLTWYLGFQVIKGQLTIGEIVALMMYFSQLGGPIQSILGLFTSWRINKVSLNRIDDILLSPTEKETGKNLLSIGERSDIKFNNVDFAYEKDPVLKGLQLMIEPNLLTAIVGESGSGKSTLVNLILKFYSPQHGVVLIEDKKVSDLMVNSLRSQVSLVSQDYTIFSGTILENILYGNPGKNRDDAIDAAKSAAAWSFISQLEKGIETELGSDGAGLSGGQKQRIAIARALLRDTPVMIFDEATAALDAESEFHIQEIMRQLKKHKTVIAIAHRLSTIKEADKIIVMESGRAVEEGKFEELLERKGRFYKFYWKQFGGLGALRQSLFTELERAKRYGSHFCTVMIRFWNLKKDKIEILEDLNSQIRLQIRVGDNCAPLGIKDKVGDIIVVLPEINEEQLKLFFKRLKSVINSWNIGGTYSFVGSRFSGKNFSTPEEIFSALKNSFSQKGIWGGNDLIIDEGELHEIR